MFIRRIHNRDKSTNIFIEILQNTRRDNNVTFIKISNPIANTIAFIRERDILEIVI